MLSEALEIVQNGRNVDLQSGPGQSFEQIIPLFNQLTGHNLKISDGPIFMMVLKLVRQMNKPKRDNLVDLCGYASILNDIEEHCNQEDKVHILDRDSNENQRTFRHSER